MNILSCVFRHSSLFPVAVFEFLILFSSVCAWECTLDGVSRFLIFSPLVLQSQTDDVSLVCYQMYGLGSWDSTIVVTYGHWSKDYVYGNLPRLSSLAKLTVCAILLVEKCMAYALLMLLAPNNVLFPSFQIICFGFPEYILCVRIYAMFRCKIKTMY